MECLHGEFDMEPGNGGDRCEYLKERGIDSYLVVVPKGPLGKNGINGVVSIASAPSFIQPLFLQVRLTEIKPL